MKDGYPENGEIKKYNNYPTKEQWDTRLGTMDMFVFESVIKKLIKETPNDTELGKLIREKYGV